MCSLPLCCHSLGAPVRTRRRPLKGKFVLFHMRLRPACYHFLGPSSHGKEKLWICKNTHSVFCNTSCHRYTEFSLASSDTKCAWFGPNLHYYDFRHQNPDKTASTVLEILRNGYVPSIHSTRCGQTSYCIISMHYYGCTCAKALRQPEPQAGILANVGEAPEPVGILANVGREGPYCQS